MRRVVEDGDLILMFILAFVSVLFAELEMAPEAAQTRVVLVMLGMFAFHLLRVSSRTRKLGGKLRTIEKKIEFSEMAERLHQIGLLSIVKRRADFSIDEIQKELTNAKEVFILVRYFRAFANKGVQDTVTKCLSNNGRVRVITYSPEGPHLDVQLEPDIKSQEASARINEALRRLWNFQTSLDPEHRPRFDFRVLRGHIIYAQIMGTEKVVLVTNYLNDLRGEECPSLLCRNIESPKHDLYSVYRNEFERLWATSEGLESSSGESILSTA